MSPRIVLILSRARAVDVLDSLGDVFSVADLSR